MASSSSTTRNWRDSLYLAFFFISFASMFLVDLVHFIPHSLWVPPSSPLHFLQQIRNFYTSTYHDLFLLTPWPQQPTFFRLFTILELVYQLPAVAWILRRYFRDGREGAVAGKTGGTTPALELACLVYGVQCALTTLTCIYDCLEWEGELYTWEVKKELIFKLYMPWFLIPLGMSVDMYLRILNRFRGQGEKTLKSQ
ncbi:hypothetical protein SAPIO_CDS8462 [Scedosporium apiospermum]|uniref:EXPERA domain-containing protein n=1 Tax=Pseudallescheria apiosperma TaxID=563466 RepID=A0A084FZN9_PSEDA|nr:uncharacterized protein SAPIO_CDS8462 [Scedosporium apiospermum]KEZ40551.1 hypothetical protein SAPIO_CDS8462 [Scedosporium apiospermum]